MVGIMADLYVCDLARYYRRSPELISYEEVTGWLYHLIKERQLSASSVNIAVSAVRFLYAVTLGRETLDLMASVSDMKRAIGRADSEVEAILTPPRQPRGRPMTPLQNIYYSALKKSGVRYKGGIHTLRHYPEFRTIPSTLAVAAPNPLLTGLGAASVRQLNSA